MPITLYTSTMSPPARAVQLLIKELELKVKVKLVDARAGETRTEEFLRMNPQHTIPTIDDNGFYLWESRAILAYLVETYRQGHDLYPTIPKERALINRVLHHDSSAFYPQIIGTLYPIFRGEAKVITPEMKATVEKALATLELLLIRNDWFAGEKITIADMALLPTIATLAHSGFDLTKFPRLLAWYDNCKELKGYPEEQAIAVQAGQFVRSMLTEGL
ncbi:glutathione S-transferase 1-1-like [Wyeomyia smithii]|uniref:glutathione S-transferase 1-1-like n=1 Tax=Wyeomyia smithii TaxID=174621 RepID=UPI002467B199|nr:glutathione S-transferase 1-1-like [Wyeomyia smithii]